MKKSVVKCICLGIFISMIFSVFSIYSFAVKNDDSDFTTESDENDSLLECNHDPSINSMDKMLK